MKKLLVALMFSSSAVAVDHTYIFGDSLSAPTGCEWAKQLDGAVHNYAQAGLTLHALDVPSHLVIKRPSKTVIFIGTNDAGRGFPLLRFTQKFRSLVFEMKARGSDVLVVGSPKAPFFPDSVDTFRNRMRDTAYNMQVEYTEPTWTHHETTDGVHPTCEAQERFGQKMKYLLDR